MPNGIQQIDHRLFLKLLASGHLERRIDSVHVHHTWHPRHADFRGLRTVEAMQRVHIEERGFRDIAQHLTIDPAGGLWTGRSWSLPPASARGHNGTLYRGPFMIEVVGNFDVGRDRWGGPQLDALVAVLAGLLNRFELDPRAIRFHREFSAKSCPGTAVDQEGLRGLVAEARREPGNVPTATPGTRRYLAASELLAPGAATRDLGEGWEDAEVPEGPELERAMHAVTAPGSRRGEDGLGPAACERLRKHVINLSLGRLSRRGAFETSPEDLARIFEHHVPAFFASRPEGSPRRLLLFAHGGLVSEDQGLATAHRNVDWWLENGVYPVFFVWETGWLETIVQKLFGSRAARGLDDVADRVLEFTVGGPARLLWGGMKDSARLASERDAGDGEAGGAYRTVQLLRGLAKRQPALELHALGHSAGAIVLSHLVDVARRGANPLSFRTLQFLAPAARVDLFLDKVERHVDGSAVRAFAIFTMTREYERRDRVGPYNKSLLYWVSRACEPRRRTPILGLQDSILAEPKLVSLFERPHADIVWATPLEAGETRPPRDDSRATTHGGFDDDAPTMNSVLRRVLDLPDDQGLPLPRVTPSATRAAAAALPGVPAAVAAATPAPARPLPPAGAGPAAGGGATATPAQASDGDRLVALCIGIDRYRERPLAGCVADMHLWSDTLRQLGFEVRTLGDGAATWEAIRGALAELVQEANEGAEVVMHFSGHGTRLPDLDDDESDRFDEALVPVDGEAGRFLLDDDIGEILAGLETGARLTLFFDCCHSGTASRAAPDTPNLETGDLRARFLPATRELRAAHRRFRVDRAGHSASGATRTDRGGFDLATRAVQFAACQDTQFAYESAGQGHYTLEATGRLVNAVLDGTSIGTFQGRLENAFNDDPRQRPKLFHDGPWDAPLLPVAARLNR